MGMDVQYRDLPGGTLTLRFADELPRRLMCGTCGMLSMQMFEDKQGHAFCIVCVYQKSQVATIFCQYENKDVALDELVESFDIVQVIKDQVVYCPNEQKGCRAYSPLCEIEDHYLQCEMTEIECVQCQQRISGRHWKSHSRNCPRKIVQCRFCATAFPQIDIQTHQALCPENPDCITSSSVQQSYRSNASASPLSAERGNRSEHVSTSNAELHEQCDITSEVDDAGRQFGSLNITHLHKHALTFLGIVGNFPLINFLRRNAFTRNFGLPLFAIVCISLLLRRRRNQ
ncbi:TNF receptor-associated factor 6-like isoform X2 [Rhipicephalus sanguineus]|uniref:TNF receptor-associated factor 6-like isoform X2 n=1 Tax=Rhipicephalus sanguineus TaxID=34632 RepID=UPI0020C56081|nr:TNF receptor-associated factor 6-like isoform X2 [Rhipicephalus sanguineus]